MNGIRKATKTWNLISALFAFALILLMIVLEIVECKVYLENSPPSEDNWGEGLIVLAAIVLAIYAGIPMFVGAALQLISAIGVYRAQKRTRGFIITGVVGHFFTAIPLLVFDFLLIYASVPGVVSKVLYVLIVAAYIWLAISRIRLAKKIKEQAQQLTPMEEVQTPFAV